MMHINGWFGEWSTWLLVFLVWLVLGAVFGLLFGAMAAVEKRLLHNKKDEEKTDG